MPPVDISIHALREEGDNLTGGKLTAIKEFLSTPSARRATLPTELDVAVLDISIHALREEGDNSRPDVAVDEVVISIHALREEGDAT